MGFLSWLTLIFIAAKLFGLLSWSWWLVLSPALAQTVITIVVYVWLMYKVSVK